MNIVWKHTWNFAYTLFKDEFWCLMIRCIETILLVRDYNRIESCNCIHLIDIDIWTQDKLLYNVCCCRAQGALTSIIYWYWYKQNVAGLYIYIWLCMYLYRNLACLGVCLFVCIQWTSKRLNRSNPNFVWDLTWPQGRIMANQTYVYLKSFNFIKIKLRVKISWNPQSEAP